MGLLIVFLQAGFHGVDALADPLGWVLVLAGVVPLRDRLPHGDVALWLASLALVVSVPLFVPAVRSQLSASGQWGASVPQTAFCLVLAGALATVCERAGDRRARWFRVLRTGFAVLLAGPVLLYGGHVDSLAVPLAVVSVAADVALVWFTFAVSRRLLDPTPAPVE